MAWTKVKTRVLIGTAIVSILTLAVVVVWLDSRSRIGWLLDGSEIVLENATFGKEHVSPSKPPLYLQLLPKKWLDRLKWKPGKASTSKQTKDFFVFWLKMSKSADPKTLRYAIADENGFEAPMIFDGLYADYEPSGFGTNELGLIRTPAMYPARSKKFYLRLYQQDASGALVRAANFPVAKTPSTNVPNWSPEPLPAKRETNGLTFILERAEVGLQPKVKVVPPYDSYPGAWSEFAFRVTENGKPSAGWDVHEIWIYEAKGNWIRTSKRDLWSLNGTFSRLENGNIICTHRWEFWTGEPAWKLRVRFEHPDKPDFWADYVVRPHFSNVAE